MEKTNKYIHDEDVHNLRDPEIIVPILIEALNPRSVVDVGCGTGTFLKIFEKEGITDIMGFDGEWVNKDILLKNISSDKFQEVDLEKEVPINRKYDLAICLEVLEHIDNSFADVAVKTLTRLSDIIVFSAAIPGQGGQNHVNEQWYGYWVSKFRKYNYIFHDVFRPIFWNNENLSWWYKQNMFLVTNDSASIDISGFEKFMNKNIQDYIHPKLFLNISTYSQILKEELVTKKGEINMLQKDFDALQQNLDLIQRGKAPIVFYIKLIAKYLLRKIKK